MMKFSAGDTILHTGAECCYIYLVDWGRVKETTYSGSGKEVVFNTVELGEAFGLESFCESGFSPSEFIAMGEVQLYVVPVAEFLRQMRNSSSLMPTCTCMPQMTRRRAGPCISAVSES